MDKKELLALVEQVFVEGVQDGINAYYNNIAKTVELSEAINNYGGVEKYLDALVEAAELSSVTESLEDVPEEKIDEILAALEREIEEE